MASPWGNVSLRPVPQRADVVPFRPVRKRDDPRPPPDRPAQPLRPAAIRDGEALLQRLHSYSLARDPALSELVRRLDSGEMSAVELLKRLADVIAIAEETDSGSELRKCLDPLPASHRLLAWRR